MSQVANNFYCHDLVWSIVIFLSGSAINNRSWNNSLGAPLFQNQIGKPCAFVISEPPKSMWAKNVWTLTDLIWLFWRPSLPDIDPNQSLMIYQTLNQDHVFLWGLKKPEHRSRESKPKSNKILIAMPNIPFYLTAVSDVKLTITSPFAGGKRVSHIWVEKRSFFPMVLLR